MSQQDDTRVSAAFVEALRTPDVALLSGLIHGAGLLVAGWLTSLASTLSLLDSIANMFITLSFIGLLLPIASYPYYVRSPRGPRQALIFINAPVFLLVATALVQLLNAGIRT